MRKWTYFILGIIVLSRGDCFYQRVWEDTTQTQMASSSNRIPGSGQWPQNFGQQRPTEDQWLKRKVRDKVIHEMNTWVTSAPYD